LLKKVDFLVIGGGLAGLTFALHAARHGSVLVLTKTSKEESASDHAQGGIASVMSENDSFEAHEEDTLRAGAGLCHPEVVRLCIESGPKCIEELTALGVPFSRAKEGTGETYDLGHEGGHSKRRILHAGDFTGHAIMQTLLQTSQASSSILRFEEKLAVNLILDSPPGGKPSLVCRGVYALDKKTGQVETILGRCTVLATGGAGKVYVYTSNPDLSTGDGMAMAYRAGAEMANLEFVQFHPTCLYHPKAKSFLLSEALRGEGGVLRRIDKSEFLKEYDQRGSLATRDIVARAIDFELKTSGNDYVLLDMTSLPADYLKQRFPNLYQRCLEFGLDMSKNPLPVVPAAHYFCGGIRTDIRGRSSLPGLYAIGETACTGFHGANRLASNSLLEAVVFGKLAADDAASWVKDSPVFYSDPPNWNVGNAVDSEESVIVTQNWEEIRRFMWNYVGIVRSDKRLERASRRISMVQEEIRDYYWNFLLTSDLVELRNIATVANLVIRSAQERKESRGLHYNLDHPNQENSGILRDTVLHRGSGGSPEPLTSTLPCDWC
jgi:L-aspartate oxidase